MSKDEKIEGLFDGALLEIAWGEEKISPVQFNTLTIGGVKATVRVPPGADPLAVAAQVREALGGMVRADYDQKVPAFIERIKDCLNKAKRASASRE